MRAAFFSAPSRALQTSLALDVRVLVLLWLFQSNKMGGHGGLNILPQKSWNVYSQRNRARVAADEAQAATDAANARVAEAAELARQNLQQMRARAAGEAGSSSDLPPPPSEHVNFFADLEAAERHAERDAARKREEARLVARLMPDLDLGKSAREPRPWYAQPQAPEEVAHAHEAPAPPVALELLPQMLEEEETRRKAHGGGREESSRSSGERKRRRRDGGGSDDDDDDGGKRGSRHHKHKKHHKRSRHERGRGDAPSADEAAADREALARLRQERIERERREQRKSMAPPALPDTRGRAGAAAATGGRAEDQRSQEALKAKFFELTSQSVKLKPRERGGRR